MTDLALSDQWWGLGDTSARVERRRTAALAELNTELSRRHPLHHRIARVEAFFAATDDVIVRLDDDTFALVHPTHSGHREKPPFPTTKPLGPADEASAAIAVWELYR